MVLVEADKLAVMRCLPPSKQAQRYRELSYEIHTLHVNNPNAIVYLDAGASDWVTSGHMTESSSGRTSPRRRASRSGPRIST